MSNTQDKKGVKMIRKTIEKKVKDQKGITLIALVVTIVVLLILAGISIFAVLGENGIISKAKDSKAQTIIGNEKEDIMLSYTSALISNKGEGKVTSEQLQEELDKQSREGSTIVTNKAADKLQVKYNNTNHIYIIDSLGNIEYIKPESIIYYGNFHDLTIVEFADGKVISLGKLLSDEIDLADLTKGKIISESGIKELYDDYMIDGNGELYNIIDNEIVNLSEKYEAINGRKLEEITELSNTYLAKDNNGKIYSWGYNSYNLLGDGKTQDEEPSREEPVCLSDQTSNVLYNKKINKIFKANWPTAFFAIDNDGRLYGWGEEDDGLLGDGKISGNTTSPICLNDVEGSSLKDKKIIKIEYECSSSSNGHCNLGCTAIDSNGSVHIWGYCSLGNLNNTALPKRSEDINGVLYGVKIKDYIYDEYNGIILDENGKIYTYGKNYSYALGNGNSNEYSTSGLICLNYLENDLKNKNIVKIKDGLALDNEGNVYAWGEKGEYTKAMLGFTATSPVCLNNIPGSVLNGKKIKEMIQLTSWYSKNYLIDYDGKLYGWGDNGLYGGLGSGDFENEFCYDPICLSDINGSALNGVKIKEVGWSYAIDENGNEYTWNNTLPILGEEDNSTTIQYNGEDIDIVDYKHENYKAEMEYNINYYLSNNNELYYTAIETERQPE